MLKVPALTLFALLFLSTEQTAGGREIETGISQVTNNYLTVYFPKYDKARLNTLIDELESHESKVADVHFNPSNHHLTVYYTQLLALDDLLYILSESTIDFIKISGTEL